MARERVHSCNREVADLIYLLQYKPEKEKNPFSYKMDGS